MADIVCYNCKQKGHESKVCPQPQRFTRCPTCDRVCQTPTDHVRACINIHFISTATHRTFIAANEEIFSMFAGANITFGANGNWLVGPSPSVTLRPSGATIAVNAANHLVIAIDATETLTFNVRAFGHPSMMTITLNANDATINGNVRVRNTHVIIRDMPPIIDVAPGIMIDVRGLDILHVIDVRYRQMLSYFLVEEGREAASYLQYALRRQALVNPVVPIN